MKDAPHHLKALQKKVVRSSRKEIESTAIDQNNHRIVQNSNQIAKAQRFNYPNKGMVE